MSRNHRGLAVLAAALTTATLALAACGGGGSAGQPKPKAIGQNDINPADASRIQDGGELKWPVEDYPAQFNMLQADAINGDIPPIVESFMPTPEIRAADGTYGPDQDYLVSAKLTGTDPQVVTYTLNPKAKWSDGHPITWADYQSQWQSVNGKNPAFNVQSTSGYKNISDIRRGTDDYQFTATFDPKFAEWSSIFTVLYPKSMTSSPAEFNTGWKDAPKVTAGPFKIGTLDQTAKTVTVVRDDAWWGERAHLDRIVFRYLVGQAPVDALANKEADFASVASDLNTYQRTKTMPGVTLRRATMPNYRVMVFNGSNGSVLADPALRVALIRGIDRDTMAKAVISRITPDAKPLGNHVYVNGFPGYQDNSGPFGFDPQAAKKALDDLGWQLDGPVRKKDGKALVVRDVVPSGTQSSVDEAKIVKQQLAPLGVDIEVQVVDSHGFFDKQVVPGNFDITHFAQMGDTLPPISTALPFLGTGTEGDQNYGRIGDDAATKALDAAAQELDDTKRAQLANTADQEIWKLGHSLPLYQRPSIIATRDGLANFGDAGMQNFEYAKIGWLKKP